MSMAVRVGVARCRDTFIMTPLFIRYLLLVVLLFSHIQCYPSHHSRTRRMVNGQRADYSEWSFTVWIVKDKDGGFPRYCGGSLITKHWVLTAAHCVDSVKASPWKLTVHIGSTDRVLMTSSSDMVYHVTHIAVHDGYVSEALERDDLALLRLNPSVSVSGNSTIGLPRIPTNAMTAGGDYSCKAAGWGKHEEFDSTEELYSDTSLPSRYLTEITVPLITTHTCVQRLSDKADLLRNRTEFGTKLLCGGSTKVEHGTACLHDSGSPFVCWEANDVAYLRGVAIAIHGPYIDKNPCKPGNQTIIFMRLAHYSMWLKNVTKEYDKIF